MVYSAGIHIVGMHDVGVCSMDVCSMDVRSEEVHSMDALHGRAHAWVGMQKACGFFSNKTLIFYAHLRKKRLFPLLFIAEPFYADESWHLIKNFKMTQPTLS
jgi:hypothetical protein